MAASPSAAAADGSADQENHGEDDGNTFGESGVAYQERQENPLMLKLLTGTPRVRLSRLHMTPSCRVTLKSRRTGLRAIGPSDVGAYTAWPPEGWACSIAQRVQDHVNEKFL